MGFGPLEHRYPIVSESTLLNRDPVPPSHFMILTNGCVVNMHSQKRRTS